MTVKSPNRVFILGAGFSHAIGDEMPLMCKLTEEMSGIVGPPEKYPVIRSNIEHLLTFLSQDQAWLSEQVNLENRAKYLDVSQAIVDSIDISEQSVVEKRMPDWLVKLVQLWIGGHSTIITLNYDTLVERAFAQVARADADQLYPPGLSNAVARNQSVVGASAVEGFTLCKLHGSTNWFYSGRPQAAGETIYYTNTRAWGGDGGTLNPGTVEVSDKVPYIVPPVVEKTSLFTHETLRAIWRKAGLALKKADEVYLLGYSLPDTDMSMRFFLSDNRAKNTKEGLPKLVLGNTRKDVVGSVSKLKCLYEIDDQFIGEDSIANIVSAISG